MNPDDIREQLQRAALPPHPLVAPLADLHQRAHARRRRAITATVTAVVIAGATLGVVGPGSTMTAPPEPASTPSPHAAGGVPENLLPVTAEVVQQVDSDSVSLTYTCSTHPATDPYRLTLKLQSTSSPATQVAKTVACTNEPTTTKLNVPPNWPLGTITATADGNEKDFNPTPDCTNQACPLPPIQVIFGEPDPQPEQTQR